LAVVLAVLICGILPSIPEDLVHFFFVPVFFVLPFHDSLCCPVFYKDWLMKEKEDIVTRLIQSKMKKKTLNRSESWKRVWNINIYEQCKLGPSTLLSFFSAVC
jgi:hypothetical protein